MNNTRNPCEYTEQNIQPEVSGTTNLEENESFRILLSLIQKNVVGFQFTLIRATTGGRKNAKIDKRILLSKPAIDKLCQA